jgi:hypothetical protein
MNTGTKYKEVRVLKYKKPKHKSDNWDVFQDTEKVVYENSSIFISGNNIIIEDENKKGVIFDISQIHSYQLIE